MTKVLQFFLAFISVMQVIPSALLTSLLSKFLQLLPVSRLQSKTAFDLQSRNVGSQDDAEK